MRGKKSKRLRRLAETLTPGRPARAYEAKGDTIRLVPGCTRRVYRRLKSPRKVTGWLRGKIEGNESGFAEER